MNKQRRIYLAILAVAIVALTVDRLFLIDGASGPADAEAAIEQASEELLIQPGYTDQIEEARARVDDSTARLEEEHTLTRRFERLAERRPFNADAVANAFAVPAAWRAAQTQPAEPDEAAAADPQPDRLDAFRRAHTLQAVIRRGDGGGLAIINDRPLRVGDRIGAFSLTRLAGDHAVLESDDGRVTLQLERDLPRQGDEGETSAR